MNNKLICPFCNSELVKDTPFAWSCPNEECVETDMMWGTANMWQELIRTRKALETGNKDLSDKIGKLETELIRTRKALDVAVSQLKKTSDYIEDCRYQETNYFLVDSKDVSIVLDETNDALEQITALKQKNIK